MLSIDIEKRSNVLYTFSLYLVGYFFLAILGVYIFNEDISLNYRFNQQFLFSTHLFTIGFLSSIFTGSLLQLMPVLFGIDLTHIKYLFYSSIFSIAFTVVSFYLGFIHNYFITAKYIIIIPILTFTFTWITILFLSFKRFEQLKFNLKSIHFLFCIIHLIIGFIIGIIMVLSHMQVITIDFRPNLTDTHILFLIFGFLISFIYLIAKNVIPMFFISADQGNYKYGFAFYYVSIYLNILSIYLNSDRLKFISQSLISIIIILGIYDLVFLFLSRKRKRKNPIIAIWYLGFATLTILIIYNLITYRADISYLNPRLLFVFVKILISAMILKIIPFLFWLNLNSTVKFSPSLSTNDFYSERKLYKFYFLQILSFISIFINLKLTGIILVIESIYFFHLFITAYYTFLNQIILTNKNSREQL